MTAYVVLTLDEYQELVNAASHGPARASGPAGNALAAAVAMITGRQAGVRLAPDADLQRVAAILATIATALLDSTTADNGAELLQALGLEATDPYWSSQ